MTSMPKISRRSFIVSTAAVGGGLALGLRLPPFGPTVGARRRRLARRSTPGS